MLATPSPALQPEHYRSYLRLLARLQMPRRLAPKVDSSDIVQQTLVQAYKALGGFQGRTEGEMVAWLRQILARNMLHAIRDQAREKRDATREVSLAAAMDQSSARIEAWLAAEDTSPSAVAERNEQLLRLASALEQLPDEQREAIELHYWQGWTLAEIAEYQQRTIGSVAGLVHRGLAKLRVVLAGE